MCVLNSSPCSSLKITGDVESYLAVDLDDHTY